MKSIQVVKESSSMSIELPVSQFGSCVELYILLDLKFQKIKVPINKSHAEQFREAKNQIFFSIFTLNVSTDMPEHANSTGPDQTGPYQSDQGLHSLPCSHTL